jgi:hypothetical protein
MYVAVRRYDGVYRPPKGGAAAPGGLRALNQRNAWIRGLPIGSTPATA